MKINTLGRSALNAGLARKMSVSSLTGSNTDQPICGTSSSAAVAMARRKVEVMASPFSSFQHLTSAAGPGELPDLDALHHRCPGAGKRVGHADAEFPVVVRSEERRVGKECRSRWSPYH